VVALLAGTAGGCAATDTGLPPRAVTEVAVATKVIASTRLSDTRAVLTATRTREATATVRLTVYRRSGGGWKSTGTRRVGERRGWFWHVVTGPAAVCELALANTPQRTVAVRLAISASIGCAPATRHFHVEDGRLVPG
jgi:hypothetical protein